MKRWRWRIPIVLTPRGDPDFILMAQALWDTIRKKIAKRRKHTQPEHTDHDHDTNGNDNNPDNPDGGDPVA